MVLQHDYKFYFKLLILLNLLFLSRLLVAQSLWSFETGGPIVATPLVDEETIYIGSNDKTFYAVSKNGDQKWKYESPNPIKTRPALLGEVVMFGSGNSLFGLNKNTGALLWEHNTPGTVVVQYDDWDVKDASPYIHNGLAYYGNGYGDLFGIDPTSGEEKFKYSTGLGNAIRTRPTVVEDVIYFGDRGGKVFAYDLESNQLLWTTSTFTGAIPYIEFGPIIGEMVVSGDLLFFAIKNGKFQVLNRNTGELAWSKGGQNGTWWSSIPSVKEDVLYIGTSNGHDIKALDKHTGTQLWVRGLGLAAYGQALLKDNNIFVLTSDESYPIPYPGRGSLHVISSDDGTQLSKIDLNGSVFGSPVISNKIIYFGSGDGKLNAYDMSEFVTTSNENLKKKIGLKIFPNPFTNKVTIEIGDHDQQAEKFELYNNEGKVVLIQKLSQASKVQDVSMFNYPKGIYTYNVTFRNGENVSGSIYKN